MVEQALRIAVGNIVLAVLRRDANPGALRSNFGSDRIDHLEQEARAILDAAAVSVGALVGAVAQELIDQIAVGAMHLDAIEPCVHRVPRRMRILGDNGGDLGELECARFRNRLEALCRERLSLGLERRRSDRQRASRLEGLMRYASDMPELQHHPSAAGMHRPGHAFPPLDLRGAMDSRCGDIALTLRHDLAGFGDDRGPRSPAERNRER